jgi:hypothetical protein
VKKTEFLHPEILGKVRQTVCCINKKGQSSNSVDMHTKEYSRKYVFGHITSTLEGNMAKVLGIFYPQSF